MGAGHEARGGEFLDDDGAPHAVVAAVGRDLFPHLGQTLALLEINHGERPTGLQGCEEAGVHPGGIGEMMIDAPDENRITAGDGQVRLLRARLEDGNVLPPSRKFLQLCDLLGNDFRRVDAARRPDALGKYHGDFAVAGADVGNRARRAPVEQLREPLRFNLEGVLRESRRRRERGDDQREDEPPSLQPRIITDFPPFMSCALCRAPEQSLHLIGVPAKIGRLKIMLAFLCGAMEYAPDGGAGWRERIRLWIQENLNHRVYDPVIEAQRLFTAEELRNLPAWKTSDPERCRRAMRIAINHDLDVMMRQADYVVCLWDEAAARGGGSQAELTAAYRKGIPGLLHISFLNPAWEPSDVRHHLYSCGYERDEDALEVETQWVRNKTSPFSSLLMPR